MTYFERVKHYDIEMDAGPVQNKGINVFDCLVELCEYMQENKTDVAITKEDMADGCLARCHFMIGKTLCTPHTTCMSLQGWLVKEAEMKL